MFLVIRKKTFAKIFFLSTALGVVMYVVLAFYTFHTAFLTIQGRRNENDKDYSEERFDKDLKYILLWRHGDNTSYLGNGQEPFINKKCKYINCFVTTDRNLLNSDYKNFDAIIFKIEDIRKWNTERMPQSRSIKQKYIFYAMESSDEDPVCNIHADGYFNWTWSYKLYSDIFTPFIKVIDEKNKTVAPKTEILWKENMDQISNEKVFDFANKTKAVAWIVNRCVTRNNMINTAKTLHNALRKFGFSVDMFGKCVLNECPNKTIDGCLEAIRNKYYFYLAFEESNAEDYVTTEVLKATNYNSVPIVLGGADYTKFLPDRSYINLQHIDVQDIAAKLHYLMNNPKAYFNFFKWTNHYKIIAATNNGVCQLCALLNNAKKFKQYSCYLNFRKWWYHGVLRERCLPKGADSVDTLLSYQKIKDSS